MGKKTAKKIACAAMGLIAALSCFACDNQGGNMDNNGALDPNPGGPSIIIPTETWDTKTEGRVLTRPQVKNESVKELLRDLNFSQGFNVTLFHANSSNGQKAGQLTYNGDKAEGDSVWTMAQWGCTHDMVEDGIFNRDGGVLSYDDGGKKLVVDSNKTGRLTMAIAGSEEYTRDADGDVRERTDITENWPHILAEQSVGHTISASAQNLYMEIDYEITKCVSLVNREKYPINAELNAAQFQWFITLTDINPQSESYNDSMWFGFSMFDTRALGKTPAGVAAYDGGKEDSTGLFIYMPSLEQVANNASSEATIPSSVVNKRCKVRFDILPFIKSGLKIARQQGALTGATVDNLRIGSTNIGWELPGNFDVEAEIYEMNMYEVY